MAISRLGTRFMAVGWSREVPLIEVFNTWQVYGRHSVPCEKAAVESLAALWRPVVERFHCILSLVGKLQERLVHNFLLGLSIVPYLPTSLVSAGRVAPSRRP